MRRALALVLLAAIGVVWATTVWGCGPAATVAPSVVAVEAGAPAKGSASARVPAALGTAIDDFGFELLRAIDADPGNTNTVISPFSIHDALSMTAVGATGDTLVQMRPALAYGSWPEAESNQAWADLISALRSDAATMAVANSIWVQDGFPIRETFAATDREYFGAEVRTIDLQADGADNAINEWVSNNTAGKIDKIINGVDPLAVMYLVNATHFKAAWQDPFAPDSTDELPFTLPDGSTTTARMMHRSGQMEYTETAGYQAVRLPYAESSIAMYVLLPATSSDLAALEAALTAEELRSISSSMESHQGNLGLPRFTTTYERELSDDLIGLGMSDAFDPGNAEFARMADTPDPFWIGQVNHKTYLAVDEAGTEAAAATSVEMLAGAMPPQGAPFEMICDRPFVALIVHEPSGTVLFAAAIRDPQS